MAASVITGLFLFFCLLQSASADQQIHQITAKPGDDITLSCQAPNNVTIVAVEWSRSDPERLVYLKIDGHLQTADQDPSYVNRVQVKDDEMKNGDLSLILKNVNNNDEGKYKCFYVEERGRRKRSDQRKPISIIQLKVKEPLITADPGDDVTLPCEVPNVIITAVEWIRPNPERLVYLKSDGHLNTADQDPSYVNRVQLKDNEMKNGELSLILKNVNNNDEGTYECRSKGMKGRGKRSVIDGEPISIVYLKVTGQQLRLIAAHRGDDVTLSWRAPKYVTITTVEWIRFDPDKRVFLKRDGHLYTADQDPSYVNRVQLKDDEMKNGDLSLILKNVNNNDEGTYECRYVEERGRWERGGQIKLVVLDVKEKPTTTSPPPLPSTSPPSSSTSLPSSPTSPPSSSISPPSSSTSLPSSSTSPPSSSSSPHLSVLWFVPPVCGLVLLVLLVLLVRRCVQRKPEAAELEVGKDDITNWLHHSQPIRRSGDCYSAVVYSAVKKTEDVSDGQRVVKSNRTRVVVYSAVKTTEDVSDGQRVVKSNRTRDRDPAAAHSVVRRAERREHFGEVHMRD